MNKSKPKKIGLTTREFTYLFYKMVGNKVHTGMTRSVNCERLVKMMKAENENKIIFV